MYEPTFLRLDGEVKAELRKQARSERRSMTSLIEEILRHGLANRASRLGMLEPSAVDVLIAAAVPPIGK